MRIYRRLVLFFVINLLIVLTLSTVLMVLGVGPYLTHYGLNYQALMLFCLIWGMGGAFLSLALSRTMATWLMDVKLIKNTETSHLKDLVYSLARKGGLTVMPHVGIYHSKEVNAFATGPSKKRALVAVSSGLLEGMSPDELEGVLAHEISHITNGDMITMTLLQGVVNAFVMFLARVLAYAFSTMGNRSSNRHSSNGMSNFTYHMLIYLFQIVFMILGSLVICYYSKKREFRADRGGAQLAGKEKMIAALQALKGLSGHRDALSEKAAFHTLKISRPTKMGMRTLFSTHPPLEERIEALYKLSS